MTQAASLCCAALLCVAATLCAADTFGDLQKQVENIPRPANMERTKLKGYDAQFGRASGSNSELKARHDMSMSSNGQYSANQQSVLRTRSDQASVNTRSGEQLTANGGKGDDVFSAVNDKNQAASLNVFDDTKGAESGSVNAEGNGGTLISKKTSNTESSAEIHARDTKGKTANLDNTVRGNQLTADGDGSNQWQLDADTNSRSKQQGRINRVDDKSRGATKYYLYEVNDQRGQTEQVYFKEKQSETSNQYTAEFECTSKKTRSGEESVCKRTDRQGGDYYRVVTDANDDASVYKVSKSGSETRIYQGRKFVDSQGKRHSMVNPDTSCISGSTDRCGDSKPSAQLHAVADKQKWETCEGVRESSTTCTSRSCPVGPTDVRLVDDSLNLLVNGDSGSTVTLSFPDCFRAEAEAVLGAEVSGEQIAMEWIADAAPLGRLNCESEDTCGRECYFCNMCYNAQSGKDDDLKNMDLGNTCNAKGGKQKISAVICPPPQSSKMAYCTAFKKNDLSYWQKEGAIHTQIRVWVRPACEVQLAKGFQEMWESNRSPKVRSFLHNFLLLGVRSGKAAISKFARLETAGVLQPGKAADLTQLAGLVSLNKLLPEWEAREWFIRQNANRYFVVPGVTSSNSCNEKEKIAACRKLVQDYSVTGNTDKIKNSNWVLDAGTGILNPKVFQKSEACDEYLQGTEERVSNVVNS